MKLEIGKLYKITTEDPFYIKPLNVDEVDPYKSFTYWDRAGSETSVPFWNLNDEYMMFVNVEEYGKWILNKFLWNNKFVYTRYFSPVEFEYRFEEIECDGP